MKTTLFLTNIIITLKIKKLQKQVDDAKRNIHLLEKEHGGSISFTPPVQIQKKKRKRKKKNEVERNFCCNIDGCKKSYGSENSLNQHMKIKHPEFWHRIKEKEQNLTGVNTFKTPEEIFQKHRMSVMNSSSRAKLMNFSNSKGNIGQMSTPNYKRIKLNSHSKSKNTSSNIPENQKKAYEDRSNEKSNTQNKP